MTDAEFIYARWHEAARSRDVPALLALYAEDAELESPLVPVILLRRCGRILSGICEPYCLITSDLTMRYCPILILIDYIMDCRFGQSASSLRSLCRLYHIGTCSWRRHWFCWRLRGGLRRQE